jgi:muramoyltetrapeptide carboxypeptidase
MTILPPTLKPKALQLGDTIAIVSPAKPSPPETFEQGIAWLQSLGYNAKLMPNAHCNTGYLAGTDAQRLADLVTAFEDPTVNAILCARGGYGSGRLLPHFPFEVVAKNPKLFMGFSDITMLLNAFYQQTGLVGFYSPMLTSNLIQENQAFTRKQWLRTVTAAGLASQQPFEVANIDAYQCFTPGIATGKLIGGNLSLLCSLCGTPWQPNTDGCILFLEDWHEQYYTLDRKLTQLAQAGMLNNLAGLLLCDFSEITQEPNTHSVAAQLRLLTKELNIPTGYGFSVGHGYQTATLPIGVQAVLDAEVGCLTLAEQPVLL